MLTTNLDQSEANAISSIQCRSYVRRKYRRKILDSHNYCIVVLVPILARNRN